MFCNKCGTELKNDAKFCAACGNKVYDPYQSGSSGPSGAKIVVDFSNTPAMTKNFFSKHKKKIIRFSVLGALIIGLIVFVSSPALILRTFYWYQEPQLVDGGYYNYGTYYSGYKSYEYDVSGRGHIIDFKSETVYYNKYDYIGGGKKAADASWLGNNEFSYASDNEWVILDDKTLILDDEEFEWKRDWYVTPWKLVIDDLTYYPLDIFGYNNGLFVYED